MPRPDRAEAGACRKGCAGARAGGNQRFAGNRSTMLVSPLVRPDEMPSAPVVPVSPGARIGTGGCHVVVLWATRGAPPTPAGERGLEGSAHPRGAAGGAN